MDAFQTTCRCILPSYSVDTQGTLDFDPIYEGKIIIDGDTEKNHYDIIWVDRGRKIIYTYWM